MPDTEAFTMPERSLGVADDSDVADEGIIIDPAPTPTMPTRRQMNDALAEWTVKIEAWGSGVTLCCQELARTNAALVEQLQILEARVAALENTL